MKTLLLESGIEFDGDFIKIPEWCKRIKIDVGLSENAPQSQKWLEKEDDLMIFGFEPNPHNVSKIIDGTSKWPIKLNPNFVNKKFFLIQCALSDVINMELQKFYCTDRDAGCSSLLKPKHFKVSEMVDVQVWSLDHFLRYVPFHKINYIDFIKTDCQGADLKVAKGCLNHISKIGIFTVEADNWRYYGSSNSASSIANFFEQHNFQKLTWLTRFLNKFPKIAVETDDPTYINLNLAEEMAGDQVCAYQRG